ncbi:hypothetical protein P5673_031129 [Acropora cervicornis]|uniref:Uncharacterized protein n=1 Tax=Acropora cervicornis TaxID=6130 RepID=A0AAD9PT55_ACRCE|nr:hypothetical protein P5673_031129 [Acropora cervicornis]
MTCLKSSTLKISFLVCFYATLLAVTKPIAKAACVNGFEDGCVDSNPVASHHVMRRSIPTGSQRSQSLKVDFILLVHNITYYNTGDKIKFRFNLTHNQSAVTADITQQIKVELSSQFLSPVVNSLSSAVSGAVSNVAYNASAVSFYIATLNQTDEVSITFDAIVRDSIQPLANLYFTALVWGKDSSNTDWYSGPVSSQPTQYAVFPTVVLKRTSYEYLWVSNTTGYSMEITLPKLNFSLLVEITTNINDFSFMEISNVRLRSVGDGIRATGSNTKPKPSMLSNDKKDRVIVIDYNVTIGDHPSLANNSKHWVGAGMRSGYQMLWVGQEAIYVYKSEPSLTADFATQNSSIKRYLIGDSLRVNWTVQHIENTSYEDAANVIISFNSSSLMIIDGTYDYPGHAQNVISRQNNFSTQEFEVASLAKAQKINGNLNLKVSNKISPLEPLDIFLHLRYKNVRGDDKLKTSVKASPSYIAGVPVFCLKNNASTNQIPIGGRAKFSFDILMKRLISTLRVEVLLPVNETSIMSLISFKVNSVGKSISNHASLSKLTSQLSSTVKDPKLFDRGVIDFGTVENEKGDKDHPDNKIMMEFEIIVNDHPNVTNGSKHWVGVGVRGGKRMISKVYFNGTVSHAPTSDQYADNVNVFWMLPPYVRYQKLDHHPSLSYQKTAEGPKFTFNNKLNFLEKFSFSVEGELDPDGRMPPGDNYAVSPIQLSYTPYSMSTVYSAPLVPVSLKFTSPGNGAPEDTPSDLPEIYKRGFFLDKINNLTYICQQSSKRLSSSCFSTTSNDAVTWTAMDQQVCYVIGQDENDLYGIACNKRAYMRKKSPQEAWYGIAKQVWEEAKSRTEKINANLVKIENDSKDLQMHGTWGGKYFHFISMPRGLYD